MINMLGYSRRLREAEELYEEMESRNVELDLPASWKELVYPLGCGALLFQLGTK